MHIVLYIGYATTVRTQEVEVVRGIPVVMNMFDHLLCMSDVVRRCLFSRFTEELSELFIREGTVIASLAYAHLCIA